MSPADFQNILVGLFLFDVVIAAIVGNNERAEEHSNANLFVA